MYIFKHPVNTFLTMDLVFIIVLTLCSTRSQVVRAHETSCKTISCEGTSAPGGAAVALGYATTASGLNSVAS